MKRLDLRKDFNDVYAFVARRVQSFDPATNDGPGKGKRISRIDIGFGLYQSGWVCLVLDTRRNPEPDGEWNEHIDETALERPRWATACNAVEKGPLNVILPDGTRQELPAGATSRLKITPPSATCCRRCCSRRGPTGCLRACRRQPGASWGWRSRTAPTVGQYTRNGGTTTWRNRLPQRTHPQSGAAGWHTFGAGTSSAQRAWPRKHGARKHAFEAPLAAGMWPEAREVSKGVPPPPRCDQMSPDVTPFSRCRLFFARKAAPERGTTPF